MNRLERFDKWFFHGMLKLSWIAHVNMDVLRRMETKIKTRKVRFAHDMK